jgi:hypothetical protein
MSAEQEHTRRQFVKGAGALVALGAAGAGATSLFLASGDRARTPPVGGAGPPSLDQLKDNVVSGGPAKDGIPSIDRPRFVAAHEARFLDEEDVVFGFVHRGAVRAYPQLVLVWHEIVNDVVGGAPVSVTYCPLTGSAMAFEGRSSGRALAFGTTGQLVNSNLLMYDRVTNSEWPQLLARAIDGSEKGSRLTEHPLVWTTWGRWRRAHPETAVLSTTTGFSRAYGNDPYGSYTPRSGYYASGGTIFPVIAESDRLPPKEVVVGVKSAGARVAIRRARIQRSGTLSLQAGGTPLLAVWDAELETARVFIRRARGRTLRFAPGELRDSTDSSWGAEGRATAGPLAGTQLPTADFLDVMWFAWYAFFPQTGLLA